MIKLPAISAINRQLSAVGAGMKAVLSGDPEPPDDPNNLIDGAFLRQVEALHFSAPRAATAGMAGEHASRR